MIRRLLKSKVKKDFTNIPWKNIRFIIYIALTLVIPLVGLILGSSSMAKGNGKRKIQGLVLFIMANISIFAYGTLFTSIITRLR